MKKIPVSQLALDPITKIGKEWMLITAGNEARGYNTMTASWGHLGHIWGYDTSVIFVRPQRYTKQFVDREEKYTLCFFPGYKKEMGYLGTKSGRDEDKVAAVGLTPVFEEDFTYFAEASLVLVCRKLYQAPLKEAFFLDKSIVEDDYPKKDFHDMYIGEILEAYVND